MPITSEPTLRSSLLEQRFHDADTRIVAVVRFIVLLGYGPVLLLSHAREYFSERFDWVIGVQVFAVLATYAGMLLAKKTSHRVIWICTFAMTTAIPGAIHFGITPLSAAAVWGSGMLGTVFLRGRTRVVILGLTVATVLFTAGLFLSGTITGLYYADSCVQTELGCILRLNLMTLVHGIALCALLAEIVRIMRDSSREATFALEAERRERIAREAADVSVHEAQLAVARAQRQEAVARIAAGAAHDLNNVLTIVLSSADILELQGPSNEEQLIEIRAIQGAAQRASALTSRLLAFAKRSTVQQRVVDIGEFISQFEPLLERLLGPSTELRIQICDGPFAVLADSAQLEQIVMNLVINARDAMPSGGLVDVQFRRDTLNSQVQIWVRDSGSGVSPELREKIFEPFVTTKGEGSGTGLGLSTVRAICQELGGTVEYVYRPKLPGAVFLVCLPEHAGLTAEATVPQEATAELKGGRVLVVDDEVAVRRGMVRILQHLGFEAQAATSGEEALGILGEGRQFDLFILDAMMPGISGRELYDRLCELQTSAKFVFVTGYDPGVFGPNFFDDPRNVLLRKPFDRGQLIVAIQKSLEASSTR